MTPSHTRFLAAACVLATAGCTPQPKQPGEVAFDEASDAVDSAVKGIAHGNTESCKSRAQLVSELMVRMQKVLFTGGDSNRSLKRTGGQFLTHCHHSEAGIAFLIHVPQLKNYKDDVRAELASLAWDAAELATADLADGATLELGVGLRGSVFYGAVMTGAHGADAKQELAAVASPDPLFAFFNAAAAPNAPLPPERIQEVKALAAVVEAES